MNSPLMHSEVIFFYKLLPALSAIIKWSVFLHMGALMLFHVAVLSKCSKADVADEGPLAGMYPHMVEKVPRFVEHLTTAIMSTFVVSSLSL